MLAKQLAMKLPTWGGKRKGAGRKPEGAHAGVSHARRDVLLAHHPVHVTLRVLPQVWNLRSWRSFRAIGQAFSEGREKLGFRLVHFSVQGNHLHLVVEANDAVRLSRGMQGLAIRIARRLNAMMGRKGKVFADRFHAHVLKTPTEVARAVAYVLGNFAVHAARLGKRIAAGRADAFSSAAEHEVRLTSAPRSWLLRIGWLRALAPKKPPCLDEASIEQGQLPGRRRPWEPKVQVVGLSST